LQADWGCDKMNTSLGRDFVVSPWGRSGGTTPFDQLHESEESFPKGFFVGYIMHDCIEHKGAMTDGYGILKRNGKTVRAHRWAYCKHNGLSLHEIDGMVVMHKCDNRLCVNPNHLLIGTHADNCKDKVEKCRQARGETAGNSKLTDSQVLSIKKLFDFGESNRSIAKFYGVSAMCIGRIRSGKTWGHL
jgi:hypothetical protein